MSVNVIIEFRAPKKGELCWATSDCCSPAEALEHVLVGRDVWESGEAGFGCRATRYRATRSDTPEFEIEDGGDGPLRTRNIVVHVDYVRAEPPLNNVTSHVKLL